MPPRRKKQKSTDQGRILSPASSTNSSFTSSSLGTPPEVTASPDDISSVTLLPIALPRFAPDLSSNDKWLLHHWSEHLSSMISVASRTGQANPFQVHLTSMAHNSAALRSTILSMAANHLAQATNNPSLLLQGYRHQRDAIRGLQDMIQDPHQADSELAFATVMMMQVSARLFGDEDEATVANHLMGAKAMIAHRRESKTWLASSSAQFLLNLFAYHDILSAISRGSEPLVDHSTAFFAVEGDENLTNISNVLLVVARISRLQYAIKTRREATGEEALSEEEDSAGKTIQHILLNMDFEIARQHERSEENHIRLTAIAYRHAAFIYLYRTWLDVGAPNPISTDHVQRCLDSIGQIDMRSPLVSAHMWPLFTAGCEATDHAERQFVRNRFENMYTSKKFPSLRRVMRDIEDVWAAKDEERQVKGHDSMARVDCIQVILRRRGREVDLA